MAKTQETGKAAKPAKAKKTGRLKQIGQSYTLTKKSDPKIGLILLGIFLVAGAIAFGAMFVVLGSPVFSALFGVLVGLLVAMIIFGRRAQRAALSQIEGKPGAAAAALGMLKRGWKLEPAVAFNKQQDVVHRLVGPPGIVLVGEGNPTRVKGLLLSERRKHERVASETPIHEVYAGGDGVPLAKLPRRITKLGRQLKPAEMTDVLQRLKALDANRSNVPLPKGPMPTNLKGARQNMRGR